MQNRISKHVFTCVLTLLLSDCVLSSISSFTNDKELEQLPKKQDDPQTVTSNFRARRAPNGNVFLGMRGKKNDVDCIDSGEEVEGDESSRGQEEDPGDIDYLLARNDVMPLKRFNGFIGMRGKKPFGLPFFAPSMKRGPPTKGFLGMRGKKIRIEENRKRGPDKAFFAMRGKRQTIAAPPQEKRDLGPCLLRAAKRPVKGAFIGMRGKKTPDNTESWEINRLEE